LPSPLGALLGRLPAYPGSALLVGALNLALAPKLPEDVKQLLASRKLRIHVRDARLTFDFTWAGNAFAARAPPVRFGASGAIEQTMPCHSARSSSLNLRPRGFSWCALMTAISTTTVRRAIWSSFSLLSPWSLVLSRIWIYQDLF